MSMISNNDPDYTNNNLSNTYSSCWRPINCPSMSVSSSSSSIYSDNSQQGFQPPLDNSQQCYRRAPVKSESRCDGSFTLPRSNSSKVAIPCQYSEFKATFYNPFETKHRRRTSRLQFKILEAVFEENPKPSAARRQSLAEELAMTPRGVQIWFQNRRAKAKQMMDESRRPDHPRQRSGSASSSDSKGPVTTICQPLYTEWDSQVPLNVTKSSNSDFEHMTSPTSPVVCSSSSSSSSSNNINNNIRSSNRRRRSSSSSSSRSRSISGGSSNGITNNGVAGTHIWSRPQVARPYSTTTTTSYHSDAPSLSSSSSPVDPGYELPETPTVAPSSSIYLAATTDHQIYKHPATTLVYSATDNLYNGYDFVEPSEFFSGATVPSYGYQDQELVSHWIQALPALIQPVLWPTLTHRDHHPQDAEALVPWTTVAPQHNQYQITVPSTTVIFPSSAHSPALHGVATTTAADNKDNFVDLAHVSAAALGGYSGTNHRPPTSSLEPPFDPTSWEQMIPW